MKKTQTGFAHVASIILLLVIVAVVFTAYKAVKNHQDNSAAGTNTAAGAATQTIKTKADLTQAEQTLNSQAVDSDLNPDQLNSDVNSLL